MKPRLRDRTDRTWLSRLLRHQPGNKSGSILTTLEPDRGASQGGTANRAQEQPWLLSILSWYIINVLLWKVVYRCSLLTADAVTVYWRSWETCCPWLPSQSAWYRQWSSVPHSTSILCLTLGTCCGHSQMTTHHIEPVHNDNDIMHHSVLHHKLKSWFK